MIKYTTIVLLLFYNLEEELLRLHKSRSSTYGQVQFNYEEINNQPTNNSDNDVVVEEKIEEQDEAFVPNPNFIIPSDIELVNEIKICFALIGCIYLFYFILYSRKQ